ncbi:hypothetical protein QMZ20_04270 [Serratia bockelmannii]|nr:hypothetical protein [Serratia bockelmannii]
MAAYRAVKINVNLVAGITAVTVGGQFLIHLGLTLPVLIVFAPGSSIGNAVGFTTRLTQRKKWRNRPSPLEKNVNCSNL